MKQLLAVLHFRDMGSHFLTCVLACVRSGIQANRLRNTRALFLVCTTFISFVRLTVLTVGKYFFRQIIQACII